MVELELQEQQIAELEFRGMQEASLRDKEMAQLKVHHAQEIARWEKRVDDLEARLHQKTEKVEEREHFVRILEAQLAEQEWLKRLGEFLPHAERVAQFMSKLPSLAGSGGHGKEVVAPIWALRFVPGAAPFAGQAGSCSMEDKSWYFPLLELFEQLSTEQVTPIELTEARPLDVYAHWEERQ